MHGNIRPRYNLETRTTATAQQQHYVAEARTDMPSHYYRYLLVRTDGSPYHQDLGKFCRPLQPEPGTEYTLN